MGKPKKTNQGTTVSAAGIVFCIYRKEDLEARTKGVVIQDMLELQEKMLEMCCIVKEQDQMLAHMQEQLNLEKAGKYGKRSEKTSQLKEEKEVSASMGDTDMAGSGTILEETVPEEESGTETESGPDGKTKGQPKRQGGCIDEILKDLPVHRRDLRLSKEELMQRYGTDQVKEGPEKVYRTCRYIPGFWYVEEVHVHTALDPEDGSVFLPALAGDVKPYKGSYYSHELFAFVFDQRFTLAVPFYRLEKWLWRNKLYIHRQPLAEWAIRLDGELFSALVCRMWYHLLGSGKIQIDESPTIVNEVRKRDRTPNALCYMWLFRTSEMLTSVPEVVIFHFDESRGTEVLEECLPGYTGTITSDGHSPYHGFAERSDGTVTNTGCLNHSRTRFVRVIRANPGYKKLPEKDRREIPAFHILELFGKIFHKDTPLKDKDPEERRKVRESEISKDFKALADYIHSFREGDFDKSGLMYDAIQYFKNQQPYLEGFLHDPYVPSNNSACERDFAGYAILRNNIKFIESLSGASATADLYSLAATAKAHGLDFYSYILYVLRELPAVLKGHKPQAYKDMEELDAFMPWSAQCKELVEKEWKDRKTNITEGALFLNEDNHGPVAARLAAM